VIGRLMACILPVGSALDHLLTVVDVFDFDHLQSVRDSRQVSLVV
jgi:hypothetical protein